MLWIFALAVFAEMPTMKMCEQDDCPTVSRIGLGTLHVGQNVEGKANMKDPQYLVEWMNNAYNNGITYLDLADVYPIKNTENGEDDWRIAVGLIGEAFALDMTLQDKFFFNCKMGIKSVNTPLYIPWGDLSVDYISGQVDWYFEQLPTVKKLDSIMLHIPDMTGDYNPDEMAQYFKQLNDDGRVDHFGVANFENEDFTKLNDAMAKYDMHLMALQTETSVYHPKMDGFAQFTKETGVAMQMWSSLAGEMMGDPNLLFEKTGLQGASERRKLFAELTPIAERWGTEENVVALTWALRVGDNTMALVGTTNQLRLNSLMAAWDHMCDLSDDEWMSIAHAGGYCSKPWDSCDFEVPPVEGCDNADASSSSEVTGGHKSSHGPDVNVPALVAYCIMVPLLAFIGCFIFNKYQLQISSCYTSYFRKYAPEPLNNSELLA